MRVIRVEFPFSSTDLVITKKLPPIANGFALVIKVDIPQCADSPTATLSIYDFDGDLVFSKGSIAENAVTIIHAIAESKDIPLMPEANVSLTFSAAPVSVTPNVTFYIA